MPIYPWLAGVFPILHLYNVNYGSVIDREVPICVFWMVAATSLGFAAINFVLRDPRAAAPIVACISIGFSLSGHIYNFFSASESLLVWTLTSAIVLLTAIVELRKARAADFFKQAAAPLNLISATMTLLQLASLLSNRVDASFDLGPQLLNQSAIDAEDARITAQDSSALPDIYYIIPEGYPSDGWLKSEMSYDNSAFTDALEARGFVVASQTQANYGLTLASLASTLNMRYVDANPTALRDQDYLRLIIADNGVARYLQQLGYTFVQLLSGFLMPSPIADINRDFTPTGTTDVQVDEAAVSAALRNDALNPQAATDLGKFYKESFVSLYLDTTIFKLFASHLERLIQGTSVGSYDSTAPQRFLDTIKETQLIASMPEATFTLVHLFKPHFPTVFDKRGEFIGPINRPSHQQYFDEFSFTNRKFLEMIDAILEASRHPPVIIFQADHGSTYGSTRVAMERRRYVHFDAYAAYYVPDRFPLHVPQVHTTINTFPLLFNTLFDSGLDIRENRLIEVLVGNRAPFEQEDVTEEFAHWYDSGGETAG